MQTQKRKTVLSGDVDMGMCKQAAAGVLAGMRTSVEPEEAYVTAKILVRFFERGGFRLARRKPVDEAAERVLEESEALMPWLRTELERIVRPPQKRENKMYGYG